jgi:hypothetical protein
MNKQTVEAAFAAAQDATAPRPASISDLHRRMSRKIETHRGCSSHRTTWICLLCGAYEKLSQVAADEAQSASLARKEAREQAKQRR